MGIRGELFSARVSSRNRTYFFNIKENRQGDIFLNLVESRKHGETDFERQSIVVYEEDMNDFVGEFEKAVSFLRSRTKGR